MASPSKPQNMSGESTVKQTIVTNLEAPRLKGVSTKDFNQFFRLREIYEKQIQERNREPGLNLNPTSYRASIDDSDLRIFLTAGWVEAADISSITEDDLKEGVKKRSIRTVGGEQLHIVEETVKGVKMDLNIPEAEDRVWTLHRKYLRVLQSAGFSDLPTTKPHIAIGHILKRVKPQTLRKRMKDIVLWRKDDKFDKKDFRAFMRELASQAKKLEDEQSNAAKFGGINDSSDESGSESENGNTNRKPSKGKRNKNNKNNAGSSGSHENKPNSKKRKREDSELPPCLYEPCRKKGGRHFLNKCPTCPPEERSKLIEEYRAKKKKRTTHEDIKGRVHLLTSDQIDSHSALFHASFADGRIESVVLTDQGSDVNLISPNLFKLLIKEKGTVSSRELIPNHKYKGVGQESIVLCTHIVKAHVLLKIRHANHLLLRNVEFLVSKQETEHTIIGRPLLESIGCDNKSLLAAAVDKYGGVIEASEVVANDENNPEAGSISVLLDDGVYHSAGGFEADGLEEDDIYIDLGEDDESEIIKELDKRVFEARDAGLSEEGQKTLKELLDDNLSIFD